MVYIIHNKQAGRANDMRQTRPPHVCFSIMHGADTAWLNDVRRTCVSLHKFNSFPCWMRAVFECCGVTVWLGVRGASHTLWQNLLVLLVQSDVKIVYPHRSASSGNVLARSAPSGNTHTHTNRLNVVLYSLWHRFSL